MDSYEFRFTETTDEQRRFYKTLDDWARHGPAMPYGSVACGVEDCHVCELFGLAQKQTQTPEDEA